MNIWIPIIMILLLTIVPGWQDAVSKKKSNKSGHSFPPENRKPFGAANESKAASPAISKQANDQAAERKPVQTSEPLVIPPESPMLPPDQQGCESADTMPAPQTKKSESVQQTKETPKPGIKPANENSFHGTVLTREDVDRLSGGARKTMTSFTIPEGVMKIDDHAFEDCYELTSVTIPDSVNSIGACAFKDCWNLPQITLPENLRRIGDSAFLGCSYLNHVRISDSVKMIGNSAFYMCKSLTDIHLSSRLKAIFLILSVNV